MWLSIHIYLSWLFYLPTWSIYFNIIKRIKKWKWNNYCLIYIFVSPLAKKMIAISEFNSKFYFRYITFPTTTGCLQSSNILSICNGWGISSSGWNNHPDDWAWEAKELLVFRQPLLSPSVIGVGSTWVSCPLLQVLTATGP